MNPPISNPLISSRYPSLHGENWCKNGSCATRKSRLFGQIRRLSATLAVITGLSLPLTPVAAASTISEAVNGDFANDLSAAQTFNIGDGITFVQGNLSGSCLHFSSDGTDCINFLDDIGDFFFISIQTGSALERAEITLNASSSLGIPASSVLGLGGLAEIHFSGEIYRDHIPFTGGVLGFGVKPETIFGVGNDASLNFNVEYEFTLVVTKSPIDVVPLPAGFILLLSALGLMGFHAKRIGYS